MLSYIRGIFIIFHALLGQAQALCFEILSCLNKGCDDGDDDDDDEIQGHFKD